MDKASYSSVVLIADCNYVDDRKIDFEEDCTGVVRVDRLGDSMRGKLAVRFRSEADLNAAIDDYLVIRYGIRDGKIRVALGKEQGEIYDDLAETDKKPRPTLEEAQALVAHFAKKITRKREQLAELEKLLQTAQSFAQLAQDF